MVLFVFLQNLMDMKRINKHTRILTLMLVSQLLLTGFVIKWLGSQYFVERDQLKKELQQIYMESQREVIDTLLVQYVILPTLSKDSLTLEFGKEKMIRKQITTDSMQVKVISGNFVDTAWGGKAMFSISIEDTGLMMPEPNISVDFMRSGLDDMLVRSTRLFMHQSNDSSFGGMDYTVMFNNMIDTGLFKSLFHKRILIDGFDFMVDWSDKTDGSSGMPTNFKLVIHPDFVGCLPVALIGHYQIYLLKKISPQIIFAIVLLLMTGLAFYLAFISLKKQVLLNRMRSDFVSNLTHELKTPVATVKVALESLQRFDMKKDPEKVTEYLRMSALELERLDGLIAKVLGHTLLEDHAGFIKPEVFDLTGLVGETIQTMEPRIQQDDAGITFLQSEAINITADRLLCQGVLINLIDNSLKYGNKRPQIHITVHQAEKAVILKISDNGPGIPVAYLDRIFDKFFRVPADDRHNVKGYGLGLSYVYLVMKSHGGSVVATNLSNGGCMFTLTFPNR